MDNPMKNRNLQKQKDNIMRQALEGVAACERQLSRITTYYLERLSDEKSPLFGGLNPTDFWYSCLATVVSDVARIKNKLENPADNADIASYKIELNDRYQFLLDLEKLYAIHKQAFFLKRSVIYSGILFSLIFSYLATTLSLETVGYSIILDSILLAIAYFSVVDKMKESVVVFNKELLGLDKKHPIFKKYIHRAIYSKQYQLEGDFNHLPVTVLEKIFENVLSQHGSKIQISRTKAATSGHKSWIFSYNPKEINDSDFLLLTQQISAGIDTAVKSRTFEDNKKMLPLQAQELPSFFVMEQVLHKKKQKTKSSENMMAVPSALVATSSADPIDVIFPEGYSYNSSCDCNVKPVTVSNPSTPYYFVWNLPPNSLTSEMEKKFHEKAGQIAPRAKGGQGIKFLSSSYIEDMGSQGVSEVRRFQPGDARVKIIGNTVGNIGIFGRTLVSTNKPNCRLIVFDTIINGTHGGKR